VSGAAQELRWQWLGRQPYRPVLARQHALRDGILAGTAEPTLLLVEHEPVITLGRRGSRADLVAPPASLAARGIGVEAVERGGLATYHGPGQLVGYPILAPSRFRLTVPAFVELLEDVLISHLERYGLRGERRDGFPGVWCGAAKVAAIGLHLHRGVSIHGFALNLCPELAHYDWIVPCGIRPAQGAVSSVAQLTGNAPPPAQAAPQIGDCLVRRLIRSASFGS